MLLPLGLALECIGIFVASKILKINLNIISTLIVVLVSWLIHHLMPGLLGLLLSLIVFVGLIKYFDKGCSLMKILGLVIVNLVIQKGLIVLIIEPLLKSQFS